jgi:hypothetical protein
VDVSIFTLNESDINVSTAYQQLGLTGWTQPMVFATQNEILNLVINNTPLYSSGRTTGAKGEGEMKLIPYAIGVTTNVSGNNNQGVPTTVTFTDCIKFIASASTTPTGYSCIYPIVAGDSGSALIGEFGGIRKIVGLIFAGSDFDGFANYITNVQSLINISPYTGQTVNYSDINDIQYHNVSGKSSDVSLIISGNTFWQMGLSGSTPTPTTTSTPTPTNTETPTNTPTTTPTPTPTSATLPTVTTDGYANLSNGSAQITGTIVSNGGSTITQRGIVWSTSPNPTISNNVVSDGSGNPDALGQFIHTYVIPNPFIDVYVRIYATNAVGTSYGDQVSFTMPCFIKGTKITLASGLRKNIEDISYEDSLLVWNFDEGRFDSVNPIWIMTPVLTQYVDILFSDGSKLGISGHLNHDGGHRIFNLDKGEFTYAIPNEHSPIGTRTFNDKGDIVTIVGKEESTEVEEIYNVVTNRHLNIFAEGILTSRRLNNLYPIEDMKFIKDERSITSIEEFKGVPVEYYEGLRLGEQPLATNSEGFLVKTPGELAYTLPTVSELAQWTVEFINKKS